MDPNSADIALLQRAVATGALQLLDEHARPRTLKECLDMRCWAHLRDVVDGRVYVHELSSARHLLQPEYLAMLGV